MSYAKDSEFSSGVGAIAAVDAVTDARKRRLARHMRYSNRRDKQLVAVARGALGMINLAGRGGFIPGQIRLQPGAGGVGGGATSGGASGGIPGPGGQRTGGLTGGGGVGGVAPNPIRPGGVRPGSLVTPFAPGPRFPFGTPGGGVQPQPNPGGLGPGTGSPGAGGGSGGTFGTQGGSMSSSTSGVPATNTTPVSPPYICPTNYVATSQGCQYVPPTGTPTTSDGSATTTPVTSSGGGGAGIDSGGTSTSADTTTPVPDTSSITTPTDYTPYLVAGAAAVGLYLIFRKKK